MGFHPTEEKPIIFAGDKEGAMGVFDASQEPPEVEDDEDGDAERPDPVISAFKTHSRTISSFHFSPVDANAVFSASYDSSIRKLDLEKGISTQVFAPADADEDLPISAIDMPTTDPNMIIFSTLQGSLGRHDVRTKVSEAEIWSLTDQKIGGFSLHPRYPHLVATASLDRTLKIWDLRKLQGRGDARAPALLGEHESRLSVSHASWNSAGDVATSSYDDRIKIYSFADAGGWAAGAALDGKRMEPTRQIPHNNQTGRWVTILKPQWQRSPRDGLHKFVIGNMNRFVDVFAANGEQLAQLDGEGITAVPAVAHFHPTMDWYVFRFFFFCFFFFFFYFPLIRISQRENTNVERPENKNKKASHQADMVGSLGWPGAMQVESCACGCEAAGWLGTNDSTQHAEALPGDCTSAHQHISTLKSRNVITLIMVGISLQIENRTVAVYCVGRYHSKVPFFLKAAYLTSGFGEPEDWSDT